MKILVVSNYRGYHTARPEAEIFIGLAKMGCHVTIFTHPDAKYIKRFEENGIKVIPAHPNKKYDQSFINRLSEELTKGYDILQLYNNKAITNGLKAVKGFDIKVVIYRGAASNMAWYNPLNYFKFFHPRIDNVVCNSEEIRHHFLKVPFYNPDKAVTIYKGHQTAWYKDVKQHDVRSELSIPKDHLLMVNVANNRTVKGIPDLIRAMKYIQRGAKISLLVIGRGMDTNQLKSLTESSGFKDQIYFLGFRKDALNIVAAADIFILPSRGSEALTKSVVEAMSLGVVPVISDIAGNKPLVDDGVNGLVFQKNNPKDMAEKIMYIYQNQDLIPKFSQASKDHIDTVINTESTVKNYYDFYSRILKQIER